LPVAKNEGRCYNAFSHPSSLLYFCFQHGTHMGPIYPQERGERRWWGDGWENAKKHLPKMSCQTPGAFLYIYIYIYIYIRRLLD
jgi:hypothetical protein